jgi:hypothetical protein
MKKINLERTDSLFSLTKDGPHEEMLPKIILFNVYSLTHKVFTEPLPSNEWRVAILRHGLMGKYLWKKLLRWVNVH